VKSSSWFYFREQAFFKARDWSGMRRGMFGVKTRFWGENFVVSNGARQQVALTASDTVGVPNAL
jgi:hypothetical protein